MKSFHTRIFVIIYCIFFNDKRNVSFWSDENWLKLIKSWHKINVDLLNFHIQNLRMLFIIVYRNQDFCSWILKR